MYARVEKPKENRSRAVANSVTQKKGNGKQNYGFVDNRPKSNAIEIWDKANNTNQLQRKLKSLSGAGSDKLLSNSEPMIQRVLDPLVATGDQAFQQGLIHGTYRPATNIADMHVSAATLTDPHVTATDILAVMRDVHQAMVANHGTTGTGGIIDWRPTGAAVVKMVVELLGEALGGFWGKQAARIKKAYRKNLVDRTVPHPDIISPEIVPEHKSYLGALQGENRVTMKPVIPGTTTLAAFDQDMLENSGYGRARLSEYEALLDAGLPVSLRIEIPHTQIPAIIGVLS